jgi:nitroreductase
MVDHLTSTEQDLAALLSRRSISPKRLTLPAPRLEELDLMIQAALRAPDHGALRPWRIIEFRDRERDALADCFEQEKLRRDPLASAFDRARARDHALRCPVLLAFVVAVRHRTKVPDREQWLAAGAALGNLLNAAHMLGYGASVLSGERCFDRELLDQLRVGPSEELVGFVSIGSIREAPPAARTPPSAAVWACWMPDPQHVATGPLEDSAPVRSDSGAARADGGPA